MNKALKDKKLRKYINRKFFGFNQCFKNNNILKILDNNNFNQIIKLLIDYKKENKKNLEKIKEFKISENINDRDISNFLILLFLMVGITNINNNPKELSKNDLSVLNPIFQYFNKMDKLSNIKISKKKKIKIKKINNININKFRINIDDNNSVESIIGDSLNHKEEKKIEEEYKEEKEKIINTILNNNNISLYNQKISTNDSKSNKNDSSTNEIFSIKIPHSNQGNNNKQNSNNNILIRKDIISEFKNDNIEFNDFQKKLLIDLSLGKDIFKLDYVKIREKK